MNSYVRSQVYDVIEEKAFSFTVTIIINPYATLEGN